MDRARSNIMQAVRCAAEAGLFVGSSLADGLRAVRLFQELNGQEPDMTSNYHRSVIHNKGYHFALQRKLVKIKTGKQ